MKSGFYVVYGLGTEEDKRLALKWKLLEAVLKTESGKKMPEVPDVIDYEAVIGESRVILHMEYDPKYSEVSGWLEKDGKKLFKFETSYPGYVKLSVSVKEFENIVDKLLNDWAEQKLYDF